MVGVGVRADDDQAAGVFVVLIRIAGCAAAQRRKHRFHRWRMTKPRAVVYVIALHHQPRELLLNVAVFVCGFRRTQRSECIAAVLGEVLGHILQRLFPVGFGQRSVLANKRHGQPVFVVHKRIAEPPFDAQHSKAGLIFGVVKHSDDAVVVIYLRLDAAAYAAIRAGCADRLGDIRRRAFDFNRARRTDRKALPTGGADRLDEISVRECSNPALRPRSQHIDCADELMPVLARLHATLAEYAAFHSDVEHRIAGVHRFARSACPARRSDAVLIGGDGELAIVLALPGTVGVVGKHSERKLQHAAPHRLRFRRIRPDSHPIRRRHGARRRVAAHAFDLHKAGAAGAYRLHIRIFAELRYVCPRPIYGVQHGCALIHGDIVSVDSECDGHSMPFRYKAVIQISPVI